MIRACGIYPTVQSSAELKHITLNKGIYMNNAMQWVVPVALMLSGLAVAQDAVDDAPSSPWSGELSLGYLASSGNTDSSSGTFQFKVGYAVNLWEHSLQGKSFNSSEDGVTTAENYKLSWKSIFSFSEHNYGFGVLDWNKNRFSGFPRQSFATAGYGRRILNSDRFILNAEVGAGYSKQQKRISDIPDITEDEDGVVGTVGGDFKWNFSETAYFEQTLNANVAQSNTYWESVSKVSANLVNSLSLGASYTIQANTDVEPGVEKSDRFTAITLDYSF